MTPPTSEGVVSVSLNEAIGGGAEEVVVVKDIASESGIAPSPSPPPPAGAGAGGEAAAPSSPSVQSLRNYWSRREAETAHARKSNHHHRSSSPPASPASRKKTGGAGGGDVNNALEELRRKFLSNRDDTPPALRTLSPVRPTARPRRGGGGGGGGGGKRPPSPQKRRSKNDPRPKPLSAFPSAAAEASTAAADGEPPQPIIPVDRPDEGPPRRADSVSAHWKSWSDRRRDRPSSSSSPEQEDATATAIATVATSEGVGVGVGGAVAAVSSVNDDRTTVATGATSVTVQDGVLIADADDYLSGNGGWGGGGGGWNPTPTISAQPETAANEAPMEGRGSIDGDLNLMGVSTTAIADGDDSPRRRGGWDTRSVHDDDFLNHNRKEQEATVARMASLFGQAFGSTGPPPPVDNAAAGKVDEEEGDGDASSSSSSSSPGNEGDEGYGDDGDPYGRPHDDTRGLLHSDTDGSEDEYEYDGPEGDAAAHRYHYSDRNLLLADGDDADASSSSNCLDSVTHDSPTIVASGGGTTPGRPRPRQPPRRPSSPPSSPSSRSRKRRDDAARKERRRDRVRRYLLCKGGGAIPEAPDGEGERAGGGQSSSSDEGGSDGSVVGEEEGTDEEADGGEVANPYANLVDEDDDDGGEDEDPSPGQKEEDEDDSSLWKPTMQERDVTSLATAAQMTFDSSRAISEAESVERRKSKPKTAPRLLSSSSSSSDFHSRMEEKFRNRIASGGCSGGGGAASAPAADTSFSTPKKGRKQQSSSSASSPSTEASRVATTPTKTRAVTVEAAGVSPEEEEHVQFMLKRMGMSPNSSGSVSVIEERASSSPATAGVTTSMKELLTMREGPVTDSTTAAVPVSAPSSSGGVGGRSLDDIVDSATDLSAEQKARILRHARRQAQQQQQKQEMDREEQLRRFQSFQRRRREQSLAAETGGDEMEDGAVTDDTDDGGSRQAPQQQQLATPSPGGRRGVHLPGDAAPSPSFVPSTPSSSKSSDGGPPRTPSSTKRSPPPAYHRGGGLYPSSSTGSVSDGGRSSPRPPRSASRSPGGSGSIKISDPSVAARLAAAGAMADSKFERTLSASGSGGDGGLTAEGGSSTTGVIGVTSSSSSMLSSPSPSRSASTPTSSRPPLGGGGSTKGGSRKKNVYQHDLSNLLSSQSPSIKYMLGGSCHDGDDDDEATPPGDCAEAPVESGALAILQACSPLQTTMSEDEEDDEGHMDGATFTRGAMASWQREEEEKRVAESERRGLPMVDDGDGEADDDDGDGEESSSSPETLVAWIESIISRRRGDDDSLGEVGGGGDDDCEGEVGRRPRPTTLATYLSRDVFNDICRHVARAAGYLTKGEDGTATIAQEHYSALVPFQVPTHYSNAVEVVRSFTSWLRQISALTDVPTPPNHVLDDLDDRVVVLVRSRDNKNHNRAALPSPHPPSSLAAPEEKKEGQACSTSTLRMVEDVLLLPDDDGQNVYRYAVPILSFMKRVCDAADAATAADERPTTVNDDGLHGAVQRAATVRPDDGEDDSDVCASGRSPRRPLDGIRDHRSRPGDDDDGVDGTRAAAKSYEDQMSSSPLRQRGRSTSHRRPPQRRELHRGPTTRRPKKRAAYETPPTTSCPLDAALRQRPRVLSQILSFLGDPATICRFKSISKLFQEIIRRNEHNMMKDAVRVGGMDDHVRPSFWLWVTLERCRPSPHRPVLGYYHREGLDCRGHFCPPHLAIYEGEGEGEGEGERQRPGAGAGSGHHALSPRGDEEDADHDHDATDDPVEPLRENEVASAPSHGEPLDGSDGVDGGQQPLTTPHRHHPPKRSTSEMNLLSTVDRTYRRSLQDKLLHSDEFVDFAQLERMGSEGKWHSVISRDVARAFGTLPPHKTKQPGESSQRDSIIRALVPTSWGGGGCGGEESGLGDEWNDLTTDDDAAYGNDSGSADGGGGRRRRLVPHDEAAAATTTKGDNTMVSDWGAVSGSSSSNLANGVADINGHHRNDGDRTIDRQSTAAKPDVPSDEEMEGREEHDLALSGILTPEIKVDLQNKLGSILHALAVAHPGVGYCQGMDYVVAHIMRVLQDTLLRRSRRRMLPSVLCKYNVTDGGDGGLSSDVGGGNDNDNKATLLVEEGVFLVVDTLFTTYNLRHTYWPELRCLKRTCRVFERLIERKLPVLADHFQHHELNVGLFALGWFQTLYLYLPSMPCATVCHMWDIWLVERSYKIFFRVGTAILFLSQPILLNQELEGMMTYLNTFPDATLLSPDILITCALQIKVTNRMLVEIEREVIDGLECQFS